MRIFMRKNTKLIVTITLLALYLLSLVSMASALVVSSVSTNPMEIAPGETSTIEIVLENDMNIDISDVSVALDFREVPFAPFESSSEDSIDKIEEDEDEKARFRIIALNDAKSGIYKIPVSISYIENEIVKTKNSLISLNVNSKPELGLEVEEGLLLKNSRNDVEITIINKGLSDVRFLEIELGDSGYFEVLSRKKIYVGDIDSDDFDSVDFNIFFNKNAPDKVNLPVILTYKDSSNNEIRDNFNLVLDVYSREKAIEFGLITESKTSTYVGIVVLLVVIFLGYRSVRKRMKKKKKDEDFSF